MATCYKCGEEIEFRYVDGRPTPIHLYGGWRSESDTLPKQKNHKPFQSRESYTNPNARCPVCGQHVFYYQSPSGARVFFDDLGWPWPKHPCTDNPASQSSSVRPLRTSSASSRKEFLSKEGITLKLYELNSVSTFKNDVILNLIGIEHPFAKRRTIISKSSMINSDIRIEDFENAPSFVARDDGNLLRVSFICARRKKIISMKLRRG